MTDCALTLNFCTFFSGAQHDFAEQYAFEELDKFLHAARLEVSFYKKSMAPKRIIVACKWNPRRRLFETSDSLTTTQRVVTFRGSPVRIKPKKMQYEIHVYTRWLDTGECPEVEFKMTRGGKVDSRLWQMRKTGDGVIMIRQGKVRISK